MKVFNIILAVLFVVFAVVQFNDPDPLFWVLVYATMALICGLAAFKKTKILLLFAVLAVLVFELFTMYPTFSDWIKEGMPNIVKSMAAESPYVELVREFLGLLICFIVLIFQWVIYRSTSPNKYV